MGSPRGRHAAARLRPSWAVMGIAACIASALLITGITTGSAAQGASGSIKSAAALTAATGVPSNAARQAVFCIPASRAAINWHTNPSAFPGCAANQQTVYLTSGSLTVTAPGVGIKNAAVNSSGHLIITLTDGSTIDAGSVVGPAGTNGKDAILTVSAQTVLTNWPEGSGWANDNFTRNVTLTREGAVPASDCGSAATSCFLYSETLADNGSFTTVDGKTGPNGTGTIKGAWTGTIAGGGKLEFYATSDSPDPANVPGTADGSAKPSTTTDWYKLFFPAGTSFALTSGPNVPWLTYDWSYSATVNCGTSSSVAEHWNDGINPGDDGQSSADGNILGANGC